MSMTRPEVNAEGKFQHRISFCSNGKEYNNWLNKDLRSVELLEKRTN